MIAVTRDRTGGAFYIVQVRQPDGEIADVRLNRSYSRVAIGSVQSSPDGRDGGD